MRQRDESLPFFLVSLVVHVAFGWGLLAWPKQNSLIANQPVEVVYQEEQAKRRQIVHQLAPPEEASKEDAKEAEFLSERRQRVKEQTRAQQLGDTSVNRSQRAQPSPTPNSRPQLSLQPRLNFRPPNAGDAGAGPAPDSPSQPWQAPPGPSEISESLPNDMKIGAMTVLNTDRYMFYTFYDRLEKRVVPRWRTKVRSYLDLNRVRPPPSGEWTTVIEILLTPKGEFHSSKILQASGLRELDLAPIEAFKEGAPFVNPPPEMVRPDNYIHILFGFNVYTRR